MAFEELGEALTAQGFIDDAQAKQVAVDNAAAQGLSDNGEYTTHVVYTKGDVVVVVEQNEAPDEAGSEVIIRHPAVAIITSPKGRVACNPKDVELVLAEVESLS